MRDLRDPTALGRALIVAGENSKADLSLGEVYDRVPLGEIPDYAPNDSIAAEAHRRYHDELQQRARAGDHHAKNLLLGANPNDGAEA